MRKPYIPFIVLTFLLFLLIFAYAGQKQVEAAHKKKQIVILYTNDTICEIKPCG